MASETPASPPAARKRVPLGRSRRRLGFERRLRIWLYLLGVPMIRPLAWAVGLAGTLMVLRALLGL